MCALEPPPVAASGLESFEYSFNEPAIPVAIDHFVQPGRVCPRQARQEQPVHGGSPSGGFVSSTWTTLICNVGGSWQEQFPIAVPSLLRQRWRVERRVPGVPGESCVQPGAYHPVYAETVVLRASGLPGVCSNSRIRLGEVADSNSTTRSCWGTNHVALPQENASARTNRLPIHHVDDLIAIAK